MLTCCANRCGKEYVSFPVCFSQDLVLIGTIVISSSHYSALVTTVSGGRFNSAAVCRKYCLQLQNRRSRPVKHFLPFSLLLTHTALELRYDRRRCLPSLPPSSTATEPLARPSSGISTSLDVLCVVPASFRRKQASMLRRSSLSHACSTTRAATASAFIPIHSTGPGAMAVY